MKSLYLYLLLILLTSWPQIPASDAQCDELDLLFPPVVKDIKTEATIRIVDQQGGTDNEDCLNRNNSTSPPPCRTLQYALHESEDTTVGDRASNLLLRLGPGVYRSLNESNKIINSYKVAIIGAGVSETTFVCGENGTADAPCDYPNFQIVNSSHIYISRIRFSGCGPITSPAYIAQSNFVVVEDCLFE